MRCVHRRASTSRLAVHERAKRDNDIVMTRVLAKFVYRENILMKHLNRCPAGPAATREHRKRRHKGHANDKKGPKT
jgi:hypothetical protein